VATNRGAKLLAEWRAARGLTQFQAAVLLDIDPSPLSKFERGKRKPGRTTAFKIEEKTEGYVPASSWDEDSDALYPNSTDDEPDRKAAGAE
jgi:transcriptional regulator with XRE-family HTH domain